MTSYDDVIAVVTVYIEMVDGVSPLIEVVVFLALTIVVVVAEGGRSV